jgi:hypothetical protein
MRQRSAAARIQERLKAAMPEYLRRAPSGMNDARAFLFRENDGKMLAEFSVERNPVVLKAYGLAEDQCLCVKQVHKSCCDETVMSDALTCCKQQCLTCCDNVLYVVTPGDYAIVLDEPNGEAIVTVTEYKHSKFTTEGKSWL